MRLIIYSINNYKIIYILKSVKNSYFKFFHNARIYLIIMKSSNYQIQDVSLWPNFLSLDENRKIRDKEIQNKIDLTKSQFLLKNIMSSGQANAAFYQSLLDPDRDIYYPPKFNEPSYCKAGLHYSIPDDVVGIGLKVDPMYENDKQWAVLYHGTKPNNVIGILRDGLKPGHGQAHKGTKDPWGSQIPNGVYFSFWLNQSFTYTLPKNPIIFECFVKDVFVAPGFKGYTVSNYSQISRILIPTKKDRNNHLI